MAARYPVGRTSIDFRPAFTGAGDPDHEGPTRKAYITDVYGLVIHTSVIGNTAPRWVVSHTRSRYAIGYADTWQDALYLADRLGECGPWNRDVEDITADKPFHTALSAVVREHGKTSYRRPAASVWG